MTRVQDTDDSKETLREGSDNISVLILVMKA